MEVDSEVVLISQPDIPLGPSEMIKNDGKKGGKGGTKKGL